MAVPVRIKTIQVYRDNKTLDQVVNEWLEKNKDNIEVMNISTSSRYLTGIMYMATIVYKGDAN